jgi:hypothetical protein
MQYKQKLFELIFDEDENALINFIVSHSVLDQVDILNEYKELVQELMDEFEDDSQNELLQLMSYKIEAYQEAYLNEKLAQLQYEMAVEERDKLVEEMWTKIEGIRLYLKECIQTNAPNANEMKKLAKEMIEIEKKDGYYDPKNWDWFNPED